MNLLLITPEDVVPDKLSENNLPIAKITGRRLEQLNTVIKATVGKVCKAGMLNGKIGKATVLSISSTEGIFELDFTLLPPKKSRVSLIAALQRPNTFTKILHCAVTMGVKEIFFIHSFKVEKSYWQGKRLADQAVYEELILGLEQSVDTVLPKVSFHKLFKPFIEDELPSIKPNSLRLLGNPNGPETIENLSEAEDILLAIGPEGGFTDYENQAFMSAGFLPLSLGPIVLRSEFAVAALLAKLS